MKEAQRYMKRLPFLRPDVEEKHAGSVNTRQKTVDSDPVI